MHINPFRIYFMKEANVLFTLFVFQVSIENDIIKMFDSTNCPALAGKPKVFLIQACQGSMF